MRSLVLSAYQSGVPWMSVASGSESPRSIGVLIMMLPPSMATTVCSFVFSLTLVFMPESVSAWLATEYVAPAALNTAMLLMVPAFFCRR